MSAKLKVSVLAMLVLVSLVSPAVADFESARVGQVTIKTDHGDLMRDGAVNPEYLPLFRALNMSLDPFLAENAGRELRVTIVTQPQIEKIHLVEKVWDVEVALLPNSNNPLSQTRTLLFPQYYVFEPVPGEADASYNKRKLGGIALMADAFLKMSDSLTSRRRMVESGRSTLEWFTDRHSPIIDILAKSLKGNIAPSATLSDPVHLSPFSPVGCSTAIALRAPSYVAPNLRVEAFATHGFQAYYEFLKMIRTLELI